MTLLNANKLVSLKAWAKLALVMLIVSLAALVQPLVTNAASTTTFTIVNESDQEIYWVFPRNSGSTRWGRDMLGAATVQPGATWQTRITVGTYDFVAETSNSDIIDETYGLALNEPYTWYVGEASAASAQASEVSVSMTNRGEVAICYLYLISSDADPQTGWGDDQLGASEILDPGETWEDSVEPGYYDFRATDCAGEVLDQAYELNLTEDSDWLTP